MKIKHYLLAALLIADLTAAPLTVQAKTYVSHNGYQITMPDDWTTKSGPGDDKVTMIFFCATRGGRPTLPTIEVMTRPQEAMTMAKLATLGPWMLNGTFHGFHQASMTSILVDGVPAYDVRGTCLRGNQTIYVRELFTVCGGEAYMVTTAYPADKRALCEPMSNQVISTFRWRPVRVH